MNSISNLFLLVEFQKCQSMLGKLKSPIIIIIIYNGNHNRENKRVFNSVE